MLVGLLIAGNLSGFGAGAVAEITATWGGGPFRRKRRPDEDELIAEVERFAESELSVMTLPKLAVAKAQLNRLVAQAPAATIEPDVSAIAEAIVKQWLKQRAEEESLVVLFLL